MTAATLRIVRYAMLTGLLLFVGITYYVHANAPEPVETASNLAALRWVGFGMVAAATVALGVLRGVRQRAPVERRGTFGLIGSAFCEGAGFMGAVYYFLGGGLDVFAAALVVFLASWAILPADPESV
ncbi:MAG TPA: hypothetical protein VFJ82_24240 [Longimicrobium sp.]|nr:hypothetical protein [Longimicrobium sp.]